MKKIAELIKNETVEVMGCTEPASIAYAFSAVKKFKPDIKINPLTVKAEIKAGKDILRNAQPAGIPGIKTRGVASAAAAGIFSSKPELNVFDKLTSCQIKNIKKLLKRKNWLKITPLSKKGFYVQSKFFCGSDVYECVIKDTHNNLALFKINGKIVYTGGKKDAFRLKNLKQIADIANARDKKVEAAALTILKKNGALYEKLKIKDTKLALAKLIEKRMRGDRIKICTFTGSGNQGLFVSVPFYELYKKHGTKALPAFVFTLLCQIYFTQKKGLLSKYCGLTEKAALALAAGTLFFQKKKVNEIQKKIDYISEAVKGLLCEGAKESCAAKAYMAVNAAMF